MNLTNALGIKGWDDVHDRLLATAIITGDPLLMIANYGQGKTALVDRLGQVIVEKLMELRGNEDLTTAVINAATSKPQDWAGYWIPPRDDGEYMKLLKSPQSLLNAVLIAIDEISRTDSVNQNNLLSLIQEGRIDGVRGVVEIVLGMMNPVMDTQIDEGAEPLIAPLADRFALVFEPKEFHMMGEGARKEVVLSAYPPPVKESLFTEPGEKTLGRDAYRVSDSVRNDIWDFFVEAKKTYLRYCFDQKVERILHAVVQYVSEIATSLTHYKGKDGGVESRFYVSGRRAGMMVRAILANHAIGSVLGRMDLPADAEMIALHSFLNKAMGNDYNPDIIRRSHSSVVRVLESGASLMVAIMSEPNKWNRLKMAYHGNVKPDEFTRLYKDIIESHSDSYLAERTLAMALLNDLPRKISKHELAVLGQFVIEVGHVPVQSVALDLEEVEDMATVQEMSAASYNPHYSRILSLAVHVSDRRSEGVAVIWGEIRSLYFKARNVVEEEK